MPSAPTINRLDHDGNQHLGEREAAFVALRRAGSSLVAPRLDADAGPVLGVS